ncbi:MAG TPA: hypothetical protein DCP40_02460 [Stenotrophomonas sp.]|nr:hypothetical protein [Stenotrophomonas sp.]
MALPPDFYWTSSSPNRPDQLATVIACDGIWVVAMAQRVDDQTWVATLDRHRYGPGGRWRRCSSYESGRAGAELWVTRHQVRLREDVAKISEYREAIAANRLLKGVLKPPFGWMG